MLVKPVPIGFVLDPLIFWGVWVSLATFVAGMLFKFLLESLILAQDERWRRA